MWPLPPSPRHPDAGGLSRSVSVAEALARLEALAARMDVTRVGRTTALDTLDIPTATAFRRDVMPPAISVSSGKGMTDAEARLTALAEACERRCAEPRGRIPVRRAPTAALEDAFVPPESLVPADWWRGPTRAILAWCQGVRLRDGSVCLVPANAVFFPYDAPEGELLFSAHTTGLALGATPAEAVAAGLLECVERDQYALAVARLQRGDSDPRAALLPAALGASVAALAERIERSGASVQLRDVTADLDIPTIVATIAGDGGAYLGCAAHPSAPIAARGALLEAAQSRVTWIQGAREDLEDSPPAPPHAWYVDRRMSERAPPRSRSFDDIADEVRWISTTLHDRAGIDPVVVDLSPEGSEVFVVRVVTPGLEVWASDPRRAGARVRAILGGP